MFCIKKRAADVRTLVNGIEKFPFFEATWKIPFHKGSHNLQQLRTYWTQNSSVRMSCSRGTNVASSWRSYASLRCLTIRQIRTRRRSFLSISDRLVLPRHLYYISRNIAVCFFVYIVVARYTPGLPRSGESIHLNYPRRTSHCDDTCVARGWCKSGHCFLLFMEPESFAFACISRLFKGKRWNCINVAEFFPPFRSKQNLEKSNLSRILVFNVV